MIENTEPIKNNMYGMPIDKLTEPSNNLFKPLPDELLKDDWILNEDNSLEIPYNLDNAYSLLIKKEDDDKYSVSWFNVSDKYNKYSIGGIHKHKDFLNITVPTRNSHLGKVAKDNEIVRDKGLIVKFLNDSINQLNRYKVKDILDYNHDKKIELAEIEKSDDINNFYTFEDYPDEVQKEAIEIIRNNLFLEYLLDSVSWKHQGDKNTALLLFLSIATAYIQEPVHQYLNAPKGKGKTDVLNRVKEVQPDQYVVDLVSFSSKSLFYGKDKILNPHFNLLFLDDIKLTNDIIELLKLLLDNERKNKIHRTVIDGKYIEMELQGLFLGLINRAKDDLDSELADRCYLNSLDNLRDNDITTVKNAIKEKTITNIDPYHDNLNFKLKCCYQWLIDKKIRVYNPMLLFLDVKDHDNRNINHYISLSKGMTFYNYNKRKTIDNITIGSYEDIKGTLDIVSKDFQVQKDKLMDLEKKIIDELQENPENDTNKKLATVLEVTKERIGQLIKGRDNQIGLEAKGYIEVETINKGQYLQNIYTLTEKGLVYGLNPDLTPQTPQNYICLLEKNPLLLKTTIIINYLTYKQVVVSKYIEKKINTFLENSSYGLKSYDNLCLMLEDFNKDIKEDNEIIYLNSNANVTNQMYIYHNNFVKNINNELFIFLSSIQGSKFASPQSKENGLNSKQIKNNQQTNTSSGSLWYENTNERLSKYIHKEIYEILKIHGGISRSKLIKNLSVYEKDLTDNLRLVENELKHLENKGFIEINETTLEITIITEFVDYYKDNLESLKHED